MNYNPYRNPAGSSDGGRFASGDSSKTDAGQVEDAFDDRPSRVDTRSLRTGDRIVVDRKAYTVESQSGGVVTTSDGEEVEVGESVRVTRPIPARLLGGGDRIVVLGHVHAVESVDSTGVNGMKIARLHSGDEVAFHMNAEVEGYEKPDPDAIAGYDEDGDPYAEDEWLPGDDWNDFASRIGNHGQFATVETVNRRGKVKKMRVRLTKDRDTIIMTDSMGYKFDLNSFRDSGSLLSMTSNRQVD